MSEEPRGRAPIILTGIQASGSLHLGNYLGAMLPLLAWQHRPSTCFFCVADLHALTTVRDPVQLRKSVQEIAAFHLAAGLRPAALFVQSAVPAHSEAAWLLQCVAPLGELNRMTQFKEKRGTMAEGAAKVGLFTYPVLQAADILLYQADFVPVGEDQRQHIELARTIAERFHYAYQTELFTLPEPSIHKATARIMSLDDPTKKMSKSSPRGCLFLADSQDVVYKKLKRAVTDPEGVVRYHPQTKPGVSNLLTIHHRLTGTPIPDTEAAYAGRGYGALKEEVCEIVWAALSPLQQRYHEIAESEELAQILQQGQEEAQEVAGHTLHQMQIAMGLR